MIDIVGKNSLTRVVSTLCGFLLCSNAVSGPITLPDSARPGAIRPDIEERSQIPSAEVGEVFEIPAVIDRPFEIDEGERILVKQFRLQNAQDLPRFDIMISDVEALLEDLRKARPDGFSIGRLQELADEVTRYYRGKGLILAQAVIPVQDVDDGVVNVEVYEGRLGRILTEGNTVYDEKTLEQVFTSLIGQPITKDEIEAALLTLTDYPGLSVYGVFQPGQLVGTADIVLNVQEEEEFEVALRGDNHGTQETGRIRGRLMFDINHAFWGADKISLMVQQAYKPKESLFQSVEYNRYLPYGLKVGGFWNRNDFGVAGLQFASQRISAESENAGLFAEKSFIRSRRENLSAEMGITRKFSESKSRKVKRSRDILGVFHAGVNYDSVDTLNALPFFGFLGLFSSEEEGRTFQTGGINFAQLEFSRGFNNFLGSMGSSADANLLPNSVRPSRQGGSRDFAEGQFSKVFGSFSRLQTITPTRSILLRTEFQWSDDLLVPLEQYSIGGADNVRAFAPAHALTDRAYFVSLEYIVNAPFFADKPAFDNRTWGELLQFSVFYDYAVGRLNDPLSTEEQTWENYKGAGFGLRFNLPGTLDSRLMWAWAIGAPTDSDGRKDVGNGRKPQFWGDITYSF